jgi:hypothetical protein
MRGPAPTWLNRDMSFLQVETTAWSWARVGRIAGAGLGGAVIGVLVAWIWEAGAAAASAAVSACQSALGAESVCIPVVPGVTAIAGSVVVISAGTLITLWTTQVRPRRLTVPIGCIVITVTVLFTSFGFPGGRLPRRLHGTRRGTERPGPGVHGEHHQGRHQRRGH